MAGAASGRNKWAQGRRRWCCPQALVVRAGALATRQDTGVATFLRTPFQHLFALPGSSLCRPEATAETISLRGTDGRGYPQAAERGIPTCRS